MNPPGLELFDCFCVGGLSGSMLRPFRGFILVGDCDDVILMSAENLLLAPNDSSRAIGTFFWGWVSSGILSDTYLFRALALTGLKDILFLLMMELPPSSLIEKAEGVGLAPSIGRLSTIDLPSRLLMECMTGLPSSKISVS